jgi:hypothetical protein
MGNMCGGPAEDEDDDETAARIFAIEEMAKANHTDVEAMAESVDAEIERVETLREKIRKFKADVETATELASSDGARLEHIIDLKAHLHSIEEMKKSLKRQKAASESMETAIRAKLAVDGRGNAEGKGRANDENTGIEKGIGVLEKQVKEKIEERRRSLAASMAKTSEEHEEWAKRVAQQRAAREEALGRLADQRKSMEEEMASGFQEMESMLAEIAKKEGELLQSAASGT